MEKISKDWAGWCLPKRFPKKRFFHPSTPRRYRRIDALDLNRLDVSQKMREWQEFSERVWPWTVRDWSLPVSKAISYWLLRSGHPLRDWKNYSTALCLKKRKQVLSWEVCSATNLPKFFPLSSNNFQSVPIIAQRNNNDPRRRYHDY